MNRKMKRKSLFQRVREAIKVFYVGEEPVAYLHPTKGYKGNKKYMKNNNLPQRKRKKTGGGK